MRPPPELEMRDASDVSEPTCNCIPCVSATDATPVGCDVKVSSLIWIASWIEIGLGGIVLPIFSICYWFGVISSNFLVLNNLSVTLFFLLLAKCVLMVINGSIGIKAYSDKTPAMMIIFFLSIALRCVFQIVLMSLKRYIAVIDLFIWICLGLTFGRYYKYLKTKSIETQTHAQYGSIANSAPNTD